MSATQDMHQWLEAHLPESAGLAQALEDFRWRMLAPVLTAPTRAGQRERATLLILGWFKGMLAVEDAASCRREIRANASPLLLAIAHYVTLASREANEAALREAEAWLAVVEAAMQEDRR